jgi:hypothetical protein
MREQIAWWRSRWRARKFPHRFEEWLLEPNWRAGDHELLLAAFLESGGSALIGASELSPTPFRRYEFDDQPSAIGLNPGTEEYERALVELNDRGYTVLPWRLDDEMVEMLYRHLASPKMTIRSDDATINGQIEDLSYDHPTAEKYDVPVASILDSPEAVELMLDRGVLTFAQDYLGSIPRLDICAAWFSFPVQRASSEAATMFHFDLDRTKWVKVFYYLTDVSPTTGAHVFLSGTHKDNALPKAMRKRGYARMSDDYVRSAFPEEAWKTISGSRGTILVEDTRGIHKGLPVLEDHRLVLQFQYSQNLFGSTPSIFGQRVPETDAFGAFTTLYPLVLQALAGDPVGGGVA